MNGKFQFIYTDSKVYATSADGEQRLVAVVPSAFIVDTFAWQRLIAESNKIPEKEHDAAVRELFNEVVDALVDINSKIEDAMNNASEAASHADDARCYANDAQEDAESAEGLCEEANDMLSSIRAKVYAFMKSEG